LENGIQQKEAELRAHMALRGAVAQEGSVPVHETLPHRGPAILGCCGASVLCILPVLFWRGLPRVEYIENRLWLPGGHHGSALVLLHEAPPAGNVRANEGETVMQVFVELRRD
jgi:hypothetical protein